MPSSTGWLGVEQTMRVADFSKFFSHSLTESAGRSAGFSRQSTARNQIPMLLNPAVKS
jgi:hypothetical protein